mgnify:CR=1 FL=1
MKLSNKTISDFIETTSNDKSIKKEIFFLFFKGEVMYSRIKF